MSDHPTNRQTPESGEYELRAAILAARWRNVPFKREEASLKYPEHSLWPTLVEVLAEEIASGTPIPSPLVENLGPPGKAGIAETLKGGWDQEVLQPVGRSSLYLMAALRRVAELHGEPDEDVPVDFTDGHLTDEQRRYYTETEEPDVMRTIYEIVRDLQRT